MRHGDKIFKLHASTEIANISGEKRQAYTNGQARPKSWM